MFEKLKKTIFIPFNFNGEITKNFKKVFSIHGFQLAFKTKNNLENLLGE